MKKNALLAIAVVACLVPASPLAAVDDAVYNPYALGKKAFYTNNNISLWSGWGFMGGEVTYRIGGRVIQDGYAVEYPFPISELVWPVNIPLAVLGVDAVAGGRCSFSGQFMQNNGSYFSGKMRDSDWFLSGIPEPQLPYYRSVYSESNARVTAIRGEGSIRFWSEDRSRMLYAHPVYGVGVGFLYESFKWTASDLDQGYPMSPDDPHALVPGLVGTYSALIQIPFAEIVGSYQNEGYEFSGSLGVSPAAQVTDEDYHLLRTKHSQASMRGNALKGSFEARYDIMKHVFLMARGDFMTLAVEGIGNADFYGGENAGLRYTIEHKVRSVTYGAVFIAGIKF